MCVGEFVCVCICVGEHSVCIYTQFDVLFTSILRDAFRISVSIRNTDTSHMRMYKRTNCVWTLVGLLFAQPNVVFIFDLCRLSCANSIQPINLCVLATHVISSNMGCL